MVTDAENELAAEIELMKRIGRGDRRSFEVFYDRYAGLLFSAAFRILGNQQAAEDLLQDAFMQIWEKAPLYDSTRGKPLTWALILTRNKAIDRLRSMARRNQLQDELQAESDVFEHLDDRNSLDAIESKETGKLVCDALRNLPHDQREPIRLAFFLSLSQSEIAARLNEPLGTIKTRIRCGMLRLRDVLSRQI